MSAVTMLNRYFSRFASVARRCPGQRSGAILPPKPAKPEPISLMQPSRVRRAGSSDDRPAGIAIGGGTVSVELMAAYIVSAGTPAKTSGMGRIASARRFAGAQLDHLRRGLLLAHNAL